MLPQRTADLEEALDLGCSLFAGEAEGRIDEVLRTPPPHAGADLQLHERPAGPGEGADALSAACDGRARHQPSCELRCRTRLPVPVLVLHHHQRAGRKSRHRSPDDIEQLIKRHWAEGVRRFFITDDNFARNKDWEPIFDRIIRIREVDKITCTW